MYKIVLSGTLLEQDNVERNVRTLFDTREGTMPGNRDFGLNWDCLDSLPEVAESLFFAEVIEKIERYEPRVMVESITYEHKEGVIIPLVYLTGRGE